jgi:hypothetical protein
VREASASSRRGTGPGQAGSLFALSRSCLVDLPLIAVCDG